MLVCSSKLTCGCARGSKHRHWSVLRLHGSTAAFDNIAGCSLQACQPTLHTPNNPQPLAAPCKANWPPAAAPAGGAAENEAPSDHSGHSSQPAAPWVQLLPQPAATAVQVAVEQVAWPAIAGPPPPPSAAAGQLQQGLTEATPQGLPPSLPAAGSPPPLPVGGPAGEQLLSWLDWLDA